MTERPRFEPTTSRVQAENRLLKAGDIAFAYRELGRTPAGREAASAFLGRLKERRRGRGRDRGPGPRAFLRQLEAIKAWGRQAPQDLARLRMPVLIVNGDMVPTMLSRDMARRFPDARLVIHEDAGHGSNFQYHEDFVSQALAFLAA